MNPLVQISKAHADTDEVCITIVIEPGVHVRVALSNTEFANTLLTGCRVEGRVVRWRHDKNVTIKPA